MATATITLTDSEGGVKVSIDFGGEGADEDSIAHGMACSMVENELAQLEEQEDNYGGLVGHG